MIVIEVVERYPSIRKFCPIYHLIWKTIYFYNCTPIPEFITFSRKTAIGFKTAISYKNVTFLTMTIMHRIETIASKSVQNIVGLNAMWHPELDPKRKTLPSKAQMNLHF
jgi:hypothetical protein